MRNAGTVLTTAAIATTCAAGAWAEAGSQPSLWEVFMQNRRRLLVLNTEWRNTGSRNAVSFDRFLRELPEKRSGHTPDQWRDALIAAVKLGRQAHLFYRDTGFICERATVDALVAALRDSDVGIREFAVTHLRSDVRQKDIESRCAAIKEGVGTRDPEE